VESGSGSKSAVFVALRRIDNYYYRNKPSAEFIVMARNAMS